MTLMLFKPHPLPLCYSQSASACSMVENSRLGSDGVNAKTALSDIAKYAYTEKSRTGTSYALMMVMTE